MIVLYKPTLKEAARDLRVNMTDTEKLIWAKIRGKKLFGVQFYRQKVLGPYIVDFYGPAVNMVIELDGIHHLKKENREQDQLRDGSLRELGMHIFRFSNSQVINHLPEVVASINLFIQESGYVKLSPLKKGVDAASKTSAAGGF